jgi:hypothetical protein
MEERIKLTSHVRNFRQIVMEHAYLMYQLVLAKNGNNTKEMMNVWVRINGLTDEWAYKISCNNTEIGKDVRKMVMTYSDVLCDIIIDRRVDSEKLERVVKLEAKFLLLIGKTSTIQEWYVYTRDILEMIQDSKKLYCFESGEILGKTMDIIFYHSNQLKGP